MAGPQRWRGAWAHAVMLSCSRSTRGYMGRPGCVQGLRPNAEHTICGIHAVDSTGQVRPHDLYLTGSSIGGGLALTAAAELSHVRAVVAISPRVGLHMVELWETPHAPTHTIFSPPPKKVHVRNSGVKVGSPKQQGNHVPGNRARNRSQPRRRPSQRRRPRPPAVGRASLPGRWIAGTAPGAVGPGCGVGASRRS